MRTVLLVKIILIFVVYDAYNSNNQMLFLELKFDRSVVLNSCNYYFVVYEDNPKVKMSDSRKSWSRDKKIIVSDDKGPTRFYYTRENQESIIISGYSLAKDSIKDSDYLGAKLFCRFSIDSTINKSKKTKIQYRFSSKDYEVGVNGDSIVLSFFICLDSLQSL